VIKHSALQSNQMLGGRFEDKRAMRLSQLLLLVITTTSFTKSQNTWYYGGIYEGDGICKGFKVRIDFTNQTMSDTLYYASPDHVDDNPSNPDNPKEWIPVFKAVKSTPIHLLQHKVFKDSIRIVMEKGKTDWGGWDQFSFLGKMANDTIRVTLMYKCTARGGTILKRKHDCLFLNE
jgi:hypothetical protein